MHLTIATAGHIDHGKSALVEALTGTHPDRLPEERARGISIELGFAHAQVDDTTLSFVDVPGHERFVRTMLAGVGGIDAVLLVVAADESVMPQTREHVDICRLLDVPTGVIALTRCDLADQTLQEIAEDEVRTLVADTPLAVAEIVRTSAQTGEGIDALRAALLRCASAARRRDRDSPARLPIDRVFTVKGFGTVVTGTLWTGRLRPDDALQLITASGAREVRVRGLQVHGVIASEAVAGQRTAVNLAGVSYQDVARGDLLVGPRAVVGTRRLLIDVRVLPDAPAQKHGTRLHVHLGTAAVLGRLLLPRREMSEEGPRRIDAGGTGVALLRLDTPLPVRRGDRLVLRSYSPVATVAGAIVDDPQPSTRRGLIGAQRDEADVQAWLAARLDEAGPVGMREHDVPARCGTSVADGEALVRTLVAGGVAVSLGGAVVASSALARLRARVLDDVDRAMSADPLAGGVPRATLHGLAKRHWARGLVEHAVAALLAEGVLQGDDRITRARVAWQRDPVDVRVLEAVAAAGLKGMTLGDLETHLTDLDRKAIAMVLGRLHRDKDVERLGDLLVASAHLAALSAELRTLATRPDAPAAIEVGWFKERYGLTRKAAIPLLEWLDRTRVTRRQGESRVLVGLR